MLFFCGVRLARNQQPLIYISAVADFELTADGGPRVPVRRHGSVARRHIPCSRRRCSPIRKSGLRQRPRPRPRAGLRIAAHTGLRCAVRARLAGGTDSAPLREVRIDGAEWRCVGRLDLLARDLWCPLGCGGDSLHVYCEFSGRRSWSLYSFLLSNSSPLYWSLSLCFFLRDWSSV